MPLKTEYVDLQGNRWDRAELDGDELKILRATERDFRAAPPWHDFENRWLRRFTEYCKTRSLPMKSAVARPFYQIARDLSDRLAIAQGLTREPDYRDEIDDLIRTRFKTRREFCKATGLSEDMLSHVLAHRKNLAIDTLTEALARIGYSLRIVPSAQPRSKRTRAS